MTIELRAMFLKLQCAYEFLWDFVEDADVLAPSPDFGASIGLTSASGDSDVGDSQGYT